MTPLAMILAAVAGKREAILAGTPATTQNTSNGTSLVIAKPGGLSEGNLMVAVMGGSFTGLSDYSGDTGWTEDYERGSNGGMRIAHKDAASTDGASFTFTASNSNRHGGAIFGFDGAFDTIGTPTTAASGSALVVPSIAVTADNSILVAIYMSSNAIVTFTTPTGMTPLVSDSDVNAPSYAVFTQAVNAGATGTRSATLNNTTGGIAGILLSVKPK